jgi:hypothetical protein
MGQADPPRRSLEQALSHQFLEPLKLKGHGRLVAKQALGSARYILLGRNGGKRTQEIDIKIAGQCHEPSPGFLLSIKAIIKDRTINFQ